MGSPQDGSLIDASEYCRKLETYLCQKNDGHLIRIVGPTFERVCGWAAMGVPLAVAFRGIDRCCERYYAKGPKRRPVRIDFCEADILELFDDWRRAVGVSNSSHASDAPVHHDRETLPAHLDRVIVRLTARRGGGVSPELDRLLEAFTREVDLLRPRARQARGDERASLLGRLARMDREMIDAAIAALTPMARAGHERTAADEIAPFAGRMTPEARVRAAQTAFERLVRDALGLPTIAFD